jgi:hypothetical protein
LIDWSERKFFQNLFYNWITWILELDLIEIIIFFLELHGATAEPGPTAEPGRTRPEQATSIQI